MEKTVVMSTNISVPVLVSDVIKVGDRMHGQGKMLEATAVYLCW